MIEVDRERLSGAIRLRRTAEKLTFAEAADAVGMVASTLYRVEAGKGLPTVPGFLRICAWLGRDPRDFAVVAAEGDAPEAA